MQLNIENKKVENHFKFLKNWDIDLKKDLIIKLTESIEIKSAEQYDFSSCFGAWEDNRDAEEIISDIYANRKNKLSIEEF